ncbi:MAG TPA: hypothetical protein VJB87_04160 [Candidatus Nanoarchaeia archaeon]|nr:hypothetical protein [Candidatus Nanoarchaeia archaeon]
MTYHNFCIFTEQAKQQMIQHGITTLHVKHALQHGATVKFIDRYWKSHAQLKVAYKDVGGATKVDIVHRD